MQILRLTDAIVEQLLRGRPSVRTEYRDKQVPDLILRVGATGGSWSVYRRLPGSARRTRVSIGRADRWTVEQARKAAKQAGVDLDKGGDPTAVKRARRASDLREGMTLAQALEIYLAEKSLRPATASTYERDLRTTFGDYLDRPLVELTPQVVRDRHRDRKTRPVRAQARVANARDRKRITASPARADGAVRALRAVVRYLRVTRELDLPDVAAQIAATKSWGNVARRKRALLGEALREFVAVLRALPDDQPPDLVGTQRDLTLLLACTGLRWSSAAGLRWSEVSFKAGTITIPADRMKGKREHSLPLGPAMLAMLQVRLQVARSEEFVFAGLGKLVRGRTVHAPIGRLSVRFLAKLQDGDGQVIAWSPHDLRRTALTLLESMDVSAYALKAIAAHSEAGDVTRGYLADDVERLRAPIERLEQSVLGTSGRVVPLRSRERQA
ncbi:tyrosine-type recombinase/integrase [Lysobacter sp. S4-A87]|uniref:tyrosine-type recombinase/integrase n=1 Tax=Lysobacter sp. S4-A87 TaxID=2925843 RepID=UPI001F5339D3|nr:tyrosine-type recombinase/integrase [Lysobacter sp. S4-A87]UNK50557.1 tyrosine-type recombinase/integrase [Lysobacter sp. S4-A87]